LLHQQNSTSQLNMAAPVEVTQLLLHAQDPDPNVRSQAEARIQQYQTENFPGFLASLAAELSNTAKPADSRRLAGLVLKNNMDAKDETRKNEMQQRWALVEPGLRNHIRESLLNTLQVEPQDVRHTAALVIAKVAAIDLPRKDWPNLINVLLSNMSSATPVDGVRQATLEALGYICEEMATAEPEVLAADQINMILTAVVAGMRPEETSADARLAATVALQNAIEFAQHNMENEQERTYIMQVGTRWHLRCATAGLNSSVGRHMGWWSASTPASTGTSAGCCGRCMAS
jgi:importin subunit beta-1